MTYPIDYDIFEKLGLPEYDEHSETETVTDYIVSLHEYIEDSEREVRELEYKLKKFKELAMKAILKI